MHINTYVWDLSNQAFSGGQQEKFSKHGTDIRCINLICLISFLKPQLGKTG